MPYRYDREMVGVTTAKCVFCGARIILETGPHGYQSVFICDSCVAKDKAVQPDTWED